MDPLPGDIRDEEYYIEGTYYEHFEDFLKEKDTYIQTLMPLNKEDK